MELFAAATGCSDPKVASLYLDRAGNDLTRAVNHFLDAPSLLEERTDAATTSTENTTSIVHPLMSNRAVPTSPKRANLKRPRSGGDISKSLQQEVLRLKPGIPRPSPTGSGAVSLPAIEKQHLERDNLQPSSDEVKQREGQRSDDSIDRKVLPPSAEWVKIVQRCRRCGIQFDDERFPPQPSSLDGRPGRDPHVSGKRGNEERRDTEQQKCVKCKCGLPARVITVSKAGPNQGKLFYGCVTRKCNFFQWAHDAPHTRQALSLVWRRFSPPRFKLTTTTYDSQGRGGFKPQDIRQGAVGDCWFLAGLAVVSERDDLIARVVGSNPPLCDSVGCFEVNLFKDGSWERVLVDSWLPCKDPATLKGKKKGLDYFPAFAKASNNQIWPCIVEKAFAKQHGSFEAISGGHVCEAFEALTGAPTETVELDDDDSEANWAKLLSFNHAGFPMGCATAWDPTRDLRNVGLVSTHAYSVLEVRELPVGVRGARQPTIKDWAGLGSATAAAAKARQRDGEEIGQPLRLLRVRNPWGKREWTGEWSDKSERWSDSVREHLGWSQKNDGTFWMTWQDFMTRFQLVDVCKARKGWIHRSIESESLPNPDGCKSFRVCPPTGEGSTWAYLTVVQPTKRGRKDSYWYKAFGLVVAEDNCAGREGSATLVATNISGAQRSISCEVFLESGKAYTVSVLCLGGHSAGVGCLASSVYHRFHFTVYSARAVQVIPLEKTSRSTAVVPIGPSLHQALSHSWLEPHVTRPDVSHDESKSVDCVALCSGVALAVVPFGGSAAFFVLINESLTSIELRFSITSLEGGSALGASRSYRAGEVMHWECPPARQRIVLVLTRTGDHGIFRHAFFYRLISPEDKTAEVSKNPQESNADDASSSEPSFPKRSTAFLGVEVLDLSADKDDGEGESRNHERGNGMLPEYTDDGFDSEKVAAAKTSQSVSDAQNAGQARINGPVQRSSTQAKESCKGCNGKHADELATRGRPDVKYSTENKLERVKMNAMLSKDHSNDEHRSNPDGRDSKGKQGQKSDKGMDGLSGLLVASKMQNNSESSDARAFAAHPLLPGAESVVRRAHRESGTLSRKAGHVVEGYGGGTVGDGGRGIGASLTRG